MAHLALNKGSLHREERSLKTFRRFLPALDMKRRQLIMERAKAIKARGALETQLERLMTKVGPELPMLADRRTALSGLITVKSVAIDEVNLLGTALPVLGKVELERANYPLLGRPTWVDVAATRLSEAMRLHLEVQVARERERLLERAVMKITQRVNLLEKVLIPRTQTNIRKIDIHLADGERAGVVRAKIAKRKRAKVSHL